MSAQKPALDRSIYEQGMKEFPAENSLTGYDLGINSRHLNKYAHQIFATAYLAGYLKITVNNKHQELQ